MITQDSRWWVPVRQICRHFLLIASYCWAGLGATQAQTNVTFKVLGQWTPPLISAAQAVQVAGQRAYVGYDQGGLVILDVSQPDMTVKLGKYDTGGGIGGVAVAGNYAYVADDTAGLQVIDVSNPLKPQRVGEYSPTSPDDYLVGVAVSGDYAYVLQWIDGLQVIDVSNPSNPRLVGSYKGTGNLMSIAVSGNYAFLGSFLSNSLEIIDVSNPSDPRRVGAFQTSGQAWGVAVAGQYAFVAAGELTVLDVSNPANPQRVGGYAAGQQIGVAVSGNYAFLFGAGLQVFDITNPANPKWLARYATGDAIRGLVAAGNTAYMAVDNSGLVIIQIDGLGSGAVAPAITQQPQSQTFKLGDTVTLQVQATGTPPLYYQWSFNGANLLNQTNATLVLAGMTMSQAGIYSITVSNQAGMVGSSNANLGVSPWLLTQPSENTNALGSHSAFSVAAQGSPALFYQWYHEGQILTNGANISGATNATLTLAKVESAFAGAYWVVVANTYGSVTSAPAVLTITGPLVGNRVIAWGRNTDGETNVPVGIIEPVAVASRDYHTMVLLRNGTVVVWGSNNEGQTNVPPGLIGAVAIAGGGSHCLALKSDGTVTAWGANYAGQCSVPAGLRGVTAIAAGRDHSMVLTSNGMVVCWGSNSYGQTNLPLNLGKVVAIGAGAWHSMAVRKDGTVVAWGDNSEGQTNVPTGLSAVVAVTGGWLHSLALTTNGRVVGWGSNKYGESTSPENLTDAVAVAAGLAHSLALRGDGTVTDWGESSIKQGEFPPELTNVVSIASGGWHNVAVVGDGSPRIVAQPWSQTISSGQSISLMVMASGSQPLSYQWFKDGVKKEKATNFVFVLSNVFLADEGNYSVIVSNVYGSVTSAPARLIVVGPPPVIAEQPQSQTVRVGSNAVFQTTISGTPPLLCQWQKNGTNLVSDDRITGVATTSLSISNVQLGDAGSYIVVASNITGSITSQVANLVVTSPAQIQFTDTNLEALVRSAISKPAGDLTAGDMLNLSGLDAGNKNILNVKGLEWAVNLTWLSLFGNKVIDAKPLSGLTNLTVLDLWDNRVTDLAPLSALTKLSNLSLGYNGITDIQALANCRNLMQLNLFENKVTNLTALAGMIHLTSLDLWNNRAKDISPLAGLTNLINLSLGYNGITDIQALANCRNLMQLNLFENKVTNLTALAGMIHLTSLNLWNNRAENISPLAGLTNLINLSLGYNGITDIQALANCHNLIQLNLFENNITKLMALAGMNQLTSLDLWNNRAANISPLAGLTNLTNLSLGYNGVTDIQALSNCRDLESLNLYENLITDISPLSGMTKLNSVNLFNNCLVQLTTLRNLSALKSVELRNNYLDISPGSPGMTVINELLSRNVSVEFLSQSTGPKISYIRDQHTFSGAATPPIAFAIADDTTLADKLIITTQSSDSNLLPLSGISLIGNSMERTIICQPSPGKVGSVTVTISVSDGVNSASRSFNLQVQAFPMEPPTITIQPANLNVRTGSDVTFQVAATGTPPMFYQWQKNGLNLWSQTNALLSLAGAGLSDAGGYSVVVSNAYGSLTSSIAVLTVGMPPAFSQQPQSQALTNGASLVLFAPALGVEPISYQWFFSNAPLANARSFQLSITNLGKTNTGQYYVSASNFFGATLSSTAAVSILPPLKITQVKTTNLLNPGGGLILPVEPLNLESSGPGPFNYQWQINGEAVPNATNATHVITSAKPGDGGSYRVIVASGAEAVAVDIADVIVQARPVAAGDNFSDRIALLATNGLGGVVSATNLLATRETGEPDHAGKKGSNSIWFKWVAPTSGNATFSTAGSTFDTLLAVYTGANVGTLVPVASDEDRGGYLTSKLQFPAANGMEYQVAVDGFAGATGRVVLEWSVEATTDLLPGIVTNPAPQMVALGQNAQFEVQATGANLRYQWFRNDQPLPGASQSRLVITNVQVSDMGNYLVQVMNATGTKTNTSAGAMLEVFEVLSGKPGQVPPGQDKVDDLMTGISPAKPLEARWGTIRRQELTPFSGYDLVVYSESLQATTQQPENLRGKDIVGHSRWHTLVVPADGLCTLSTEGSDFDTVLELFLMLEDFQSVGHDDDSGPNRTSRLTVRVYAGGEYYVRVAGKNEAQGRYKLSSRLEPLQEYRQWGYQAGQGFVFALRVPREATFTVDTTTDLRTWQSLFTTNSASGKYDLLTPGLEPRMFYRALLHLPPSAQTTNTGQVGGK